MNRKLNINTVKAAIDELFSERILKGQAQKGDKLLPTQVGFDGIEYVFRTIDTRNEESLKRIAEESLERFLKSHSDNTFKLFVEIEVERAKDFQTYFPNYKTKPDHKTYYFILQRWIEFLQKEFGKIYMVKDGKQVLSTWDFMNKTGLVEGMKKKYGATINPTHSFELLKPVRTKIFIEKKQAFIDERKLKNLAVSDNDLMMFYVAWLNHELEVIEKWLSNKNPGGEKEKIAKSTSDQIELFKYKNYVHGEINQTTIKINQRIEHIQKFRKLKPLFENLKTYTEKLKFWEKHFWNEQGFLNFYSSYFFNEIDTEEERLKPENFITIFPTHVIETMEFNAWLLRLVQQMPLYNFQSCKESYLDKIKNNPLPNELTKQEIELIKNVRDEGKEAKDKKLPIFFWAHYCGFQSVVQNENYHLQLDAETFIKMVLSYAKGISDAFYLGFLEKQPQILKQKKNDITEDEKSYSLKQIAIAYSVLGIQINSGNAKEILEKHSKLKSTEKLLTKRILRTSVLTTLSNTKTTDTKHLKDLEAAKRLISGMKNKSMVNAIERIIAGFKTNYYNKY